jgi:hypothetical protein
MTILNILENYFGFGFTYHEVYEEGNPFIIVKRMGVEEFKLNIKEVFSKVEENNTDILEEVINILMWWKYHRLKSTSNFI